MNNKFLSRKNVNLLPERINALNNFLVTNELFNYLHYLQRKKCNNILKILVVGTGGSYPAALFARHSIPEIVSAAYVEAATPQSALRMLLQNNNFINSMYQKKYDLVIGISYSGKTPDIKAVYDICLTKKIPFLLLTGCEKSKLKELYTNNKLLKIISYFTKEDKTGKEESMISLFSTLAPVLTLCNDLPSFRSAITERSLTQSKEFISNLNIPEIAASLRKCPVIHVFYEWDTLPTAIDLESKFTESGLAYVILHEKKDFSHGRCTLLCRQDFALVINLTKYTGENLYKTKYDYHLACYLKNTCKEISAHYIEIGTTSFSSSCWNIECLMLLPYLITEIGENLNIDVSKHYKPFPKDAIYLYNYKGDI